MTVHPLNAKSIQAIKQPGFLRVLEGAVRSAKTVTANMAFYYYILQSPENTFLISGNTLGSVSRNVLNGDFGFIAITGGKAVPRTDTDGSKFLQLGNKKIYYMGADNASSFKKLRGLTIGGWMADEINLHDRLFIQTALDRSIASTDRQNIWSLNPDVPGHFIYTDYIDKFEKECLKGYYWYHFTLDDNPAITEERKEELKKQYTGFFYQRYILGMRVRAEGICFPSFSDKNILHELPKEPIIFSIIGSDIGGNKSATAFALTGFFMRNKKLCAVLLDEHYDRENKDTETVIHNFKAFAIRARDKYNCVDAYTDSAEQLIKKSLDRLGVVNVHNSIKKPVVDRIRFADLMYARERLFIMDHCKHTIESIQSSIWNPKAQNEERLDDGTSNIDSCDAFEYSWESRIKDFAL